LEQRVLGKTGEKIPVLGMGTWRIGDATGEERADEVRAIRKGVELGMSMIDTAEMYGNGRAESLVGQAVKDIRDDVFIATKASPENFHYDDLIAACDASIRRLGVKHIDLYQLHWPSHTTPIEETMKAMEELVSQGKIRYIGVSNFSVSQTTKAREALPRSELASNQVQYSLTHREIEAQILPFCSKEKITVIAYSPLNVGRIATSKIPHDLLEKYGMTPAQIMLNWVTYNEAVVAIPKTTNIKHVEEDAGALDIRLSADDYGLLSSA
jgi:diketogulonate reductase-like aldo/keto reductase